MYFNRIIDRYLEEWVRRGSHKPVLLRGARQVGKSTAVRHLKSMFDGYVEINFEKRPEYKQLFNADLDVTRITSEIAAMYGTPVTPGRTLLFLDEIQECPKAIQALRFFWEDMPQLHVIAAGSLLEFTLDELPTFGVGRIHSMFMYPMTFDEFLLANGQELLMNARDNASYEKPLAEPLHDKLTGWLRKYMLIGGMPESVAKWVESNDFLLCQEIQDDILSGYENDFPKYRKKADPQLLRLTLRSVAVQATRKFVYAQVGGGYKSADVKKALDMLEKAGIIIPVINTSANGLPLGSEADYSTQKMLMLDCGLMLRLLNMTLGDTREITAQILTSSALELVNKGPMAEMLAGLELQYHRSPNMQHSLYYWVRQARNSLAEIDYLAVRGAGILPIEVKAGTQGGMKSLWAFMRDKHLKSAIRCSLENFGSFDYIDNMDGGAKRHVDICPLYAMSRIQALQDQLYYPAD